MSTAKFLPAPPPAPDVPQFELLLTRDEAIALVLLSRSSGGLRNGPVGRVIDNIGSALSTADVSLGHEQFELYKKLGCPCWDLSIPTSRPGR
jgi:hypothetical protein